MQLHHSGPPRRPGGLFNRRRIPQSSVRLWQHSGTAALAWARERRSTPWQTLFHRTACEGPLDPWGMSCHHSRFAAALHHTTALCAAGAPAKLPALRAVLDCPRLQLTFVRSAKPVVGDTGTATGEVRSGMTQCALPHSCRRGDASSCCRRHRRQRSWHSGRIAFNPAHMFLPCPTSSSLKASGCSPECGNGRSEQRCLVGQGTPTAGFTPLGQQHYACGCLTRVGLHWTCLHKAQT